MGVPEVGADWLAAHIPNVLVVDVREPDEYRGELGHVPGAELVPLETLEARAAALARDRPIVTVCRSGGRSGKAAIALGRLGFEAVASLHGGMTEWNRRALPTELGAPPGSITSRQGRYLSRRRGTVRPITRGAVAIAGTGGSRTLEHPRG